MPSYDRALWALRTWLDSWSGIGHVTIGMAHQGYDLQLTRYDEKGWSACCSQGKRSSTLFRSRQGDHSMVTQLSLSEISHVIALSMAPAFLLAAVGAFSSLVVGKMTSIVTRIRVLNAIEDTDRTRAHLKSDIPRLKLCARLISRSLAFSVGSGLVTICVMIFSFVGALIKWQHETAVAILFMIALALLGVGFGFLLREAIIWHDELDHQA
jgi:Protein of unknown function (DUF2721)